MKILPGVPATARAASGSLATATITHVDDDGVVHVAVGDAPPLPVRVAIAGASPTLGAGTEVVLLVEPDRPGPPVIVSTITTRLPPAAPTLELSAPDRVVLRCGEASIELHADGTIELYGTRIDSHAEGIQRIKGAQVRIN